jgi:hypothetical protein
VEIVKCNLGFDGRRFLSEAEWRTYLRRKPVRYIRQPTAPVCAVCGEPAASGNPLQNAHKISFDLGIVYLALTPEFLDGENRIISSVRIGKPAIKGLNLGSMHQLDFSAN